MILISEGLLFLATITIGIYIWLKYHYAYWRRKNIAHLEPNLFFGNIKEMLTFSKSAGPQFMDLYNHDKAIDEPVLGIYILHKPALIIRDLNLIKSILVKDFDKFSDRFASSDTHGDPIGSYNLFFVNNPLWKAIRTKLSPVFTSGKIKQMFPLIEEIGSELDSYLCDVSMDCNSFVQEIKEICALYTTDVIASVAFGIQANSIKKPNGDFRRNGRHIFNFTSWRAIEFTAMFLIPRLVRLLGCKVFCNDSEKFLRETINLAMTERTSSASFRNDLIDILIGFKEDAKKNKDNHLGEFNDDLLIAQAGLFFTAGFETSAGTMSFFLYEISKKPRLQSRLREEIKEMLIENDGKLTYEAVKKMEYMEMVIQEVLRLYPPLPYLDRVCTLSNGGKEFSLKPYCDFNVPHGMPVIIPLLGLQRDPKYFPNPNEFDPERFSPENKKNVIPFSNLPFGSGPHNCIGVRFALIQMKIGLISFLKNHYVEPCHKSREEMVLDPKALFIQSKGGIFVHL